MHYVNANTLCCELFEFLNSGLQGHIAVNKPMITDDETFLSVYNNPDPNLVSAVKNCINILLESIYPHDSKIDEINFPVTVIGMLFAVYNCLAVKTIQNDDDSDYVFDFTQNIIKSIPPADNTIDWLCYHSIVQLAAKQSLAFSSKQKQLFAQCINSNSLSKLVLIDHFLPYDLYDLASELIPDWKKPYIDSNLKKKGSWINHVEKILDDKYLNRWVIHEWLKLKISLNTCRNTGLILESLRRKGIHNSFILDFYESCVYFSNDKSIFDIYGALDTTETLLSAPGANKLARKLNLKGHEYYIQFLPLMKMMDDKKSAPCRSKNLNKKIISIIMRLQGFYTYLVKEGEHKTIFGEIEFEQETCNV